MRYELAKQFIEFTVPDDIKTMWKQRIISSLGFAKMMLFADNVKLTNDDIDYFMAMSPARGEDENYDDYKERMKLSKALLRYRQYLYDYSVFEK